MKNQAVLILLVMALAAQFGSACGVGCKHCHQKAKQGIQLNKKNSTVTKNIRLRELRQPLSSPTTMSAGFPSRVPASTHPDEEGN